jgi:prolyl oligopeptidase
MRRRCYVMDVASGKKSEIDVIEGAPNTPRRSGRPKGDGFFYVWLPTDAAPCRWPSARASPRCASHRSARRRPKDDVVYPRRPATRPRSSARTLSRDGRWLIARGPARLELSRRVRSSEVKRRREARRGVPAGRKRARTTSRSRVAGRFYVHTNDGAPRGRVFQVDPKKPARAAWKEIVAEDAEATLESMGIVGEHLVADLPAQRRQRGRHPRRWPASWCARCRCRRSAPSGGISGNPDEDTGYFSYSSFTEPSVIYKTSIKTGEVSEWARVTLPIDTTQLVTEQVFLPVEGRHQGLDVPASASRRDRRHRQDHPTILYGYGGFNVSLTPSFASSRAVWLEQGGDVRDPQPARRRRVRRGLAPRRHAARRSRTCSTTSSPPRASCRPTAGRRRPTWRSAAAPTAACWSARP